LCGEAKVKESAVLERVLIAGFTDEIKKNVGCQMAFGALKALDLQGFMGKYIPFCLGVDVAVRLKDAEAQTRVALNGMSVAPRILNNIITMTFGLNLMQDFAVQQGVNMGGGIDLSKVVEAQIEEVTGSGNGQVKLSSDLMLEQLALMVEKEIAKKEVDYTFTKLKGQDPEKTYLAIYLKGAAQTFKANAFRIGYDGELSDEAAYTKQLQTSDYVLKVDHQKRFKPYGAPKGGINKKCIVIDLELAARHGLEIGGFYTVDQKCDEDITPIETPDPKEEKPNRYSILENL
jgi:hypothetical protein